MHAPHALHLEQVHPVDAILAVTALGLGVIGLFLVAVDADRAGMFCGAVGVVAALSGQLISRTRSERFADIIGLVAAALAFALGAAFGGLNFTG